MASMATLNGPGWTLSVEQHGEWIETGVPTLDPNWRYTDRAGHEHHGRELLVEALDDPDDEPFYFDDDGEEYNSPSHLECKLCGEWIKPGTWLAPPQWVPTHTTAEVTLHLERQMQRWVVHKPELVERLVGTPDLPAADVAALVEEAQAGGDAILTELRSVWM